MNEFYTGQISNELWKPIKGNSEYWISNYGRVFSFKSDRFLKATKIKHQYIYGIDGINISARRLALDHFKLSQIVFDCGIPPKKVLIERIKSGKIGVYSSPKKLIGAKPWRYVIQSNYKHFSGYFNTEEEARNNWLFMYCRVNGISYEETFEEVKNFGYKRIDLR